MTDTAERTTPSTDAVEEVRAWLEENWDPDLTVAEWWERLGLSGWAAPGLPEHAYGKGLNRNDAVAVQGAIADFGALGAPGGLGLLLAAPTIATHGTQEQIDLYVRDIVTGQKAWCQLFSEPGAGSDLAGLQTRAIKDGEEWVVTGQKVWTSGGQVADMGMLIARTDPDVPKHQGITYFGIDMHQKGDRDPPAGGDDRSRHVQRGLHGGGRRPRQLHDRRPEQRLGRGQHHADERAGRPRLRWRRGGSRGGHARHGRERSGQAGRRLRVRRGARRAPRRRRRRRDVRGVLQAPRRAGQGQRQDRRPVDPPGPHASSTRSTSWAA